VTPPGTAGAKGATAGAAPAKREIAVKPVGPREESNLLYRRWVLRNQQEVEKLSGGKLGYIHIPGMNDSAFRSAYEEAMGKFAEKAGLVVDTRFNGGGDLVADLDMFLSGKKFFDYATDKRSKRLRAEFPLDEAQHLDRRRGPVQRRPLLRLRLPVPQAGQARRHARAGDVLVRRLGDARR